MMSEKTENRLATFIAIIIAVFMAVGLNAQTSVDNNYVNNNWGSGGVIEGDYYITGSAGNLNSSISFCGTLTFASGAYLNIADDIVVNFSQDAASLSGYIDVTEPNTEINYNTVSPLCDASLPVEAVDFYYQDRGNGEGSFKLMVTDEYDIDKYRIVITDQG